MQGLSFNGENQTLYCNLKDTEVFNNDWNGPGVYLVNFVAAEAKGKANCNHKYKQTEFNLRDK